MQEYAFKIIFIQAPAAGIITPVSDIIIHPFLRNYNPILRHKEMQLKT